MTALPDLDALFPLALERCFQATESLQFETFLVGIQSHQSWKDIPEDEIMAWKGDAKRRLGIALGTAWLPARRADFKRPELILTYSLETESAICWLRPLYLYGRYRKFRRDLPQTPAKWRCQICGGDGCASCLETGLLHPRCLADYIGELPLARSGASDFRLHGMGREDVDVRCLGEGRPFVLELRDPRLRHVDLEALSAELNRAHPEVVTLTAPLRRTAEPMIGRIKNWAADKRYVARIRAERPLDPARVARLAELSGVALAQTTPTRVAHRRSLLTRTRHVRECLPGPLEADGHEFSVELEAESGTYIKELISGDGGRTRPSFSELLGAPCTCIQLDVLAICASDAELLELHEGSAA